jgi:hypothetical protein
MQQSNEVKVIASSNDPESEITFRSDYVVEVQLKPINYGLKEVDSVISNILKIAGGKSILVLVVSHEGSNITLDGLKGLFKRSNTSYPLAKAYVLKRKSHFKLAKLCMVLFSPVTPMQFFDNVCDAESWLNQMVTC